MSHAVVPESIRAAIFHAPGEPLEIREFPRPTISNGETLVRVECCTLCGSDLHTYLGKRSGPTPTVLGHEILGRIVQFGPQHSKQDWRGEPLKIGDLISWAVAANCGGCFFCRNGLPQKCDKLFKYGHELCDGQHPLSGGLAEYCHLSAGSALVRVPLEIPHTVAASANCAMATVAAAIRSAGGCRGKVVLIQGAGLLGLTTAAMAKCDQANRVIVTDVDSRRLTNATQFGATDTVDLSLQPEQLKHCIDNATSGRGVDVAFEMSGSIDAMRDGLNGLRTGGRYVLVGAVRPVGSIPLDVEQVVRRMWFILGVHNYGPEDLVRAIDFLATNHERFPFREQVAGEFALANSDAAFQAMLDTKAIRVAVRPQQP